MNGAPLENLIRGQLRLLLSWSALADIIFLNEHVLPAPDETRSRWLMSRSSSIAGVRLESPSRAP